jgi:hypothetical protein
MYNLLPIAKLLLLPLLHKIINTRPTSYPACTEILARHVTSKNGEFQRDSFSLTYSQHESLIPVRSSIFIIHRPYVFRQHIMPIFRDIKPHRQILYMFQSSNTKMANIYILASMYTYLNIVRSNYIKYNVEPVLMLQYE